MTFSGGEAALNKNLPGLLRHARELDLDICVLTNATLLSDDIIEVLKETNVSLVQVSLYSMIPEVHESITKLSGSFEKSKNNIEKLIKADIPVQLSCPVMKENLNSFQTVMQWGHENHLEVKITSAIIARSDFSLGNLEHRLTLEEQKTFIEQTILNSEIYREQLLSERKIDFPPDDPVCGAGTYQVCLEAGGNYYPCPSFKLYLGNCKTHSLKDVWEHSEELQKMRNLKNSDYADCTDCPSHPYCILCPGKLYNESKGDLFKLSEYFCGLAHLNRELAQKFVHSHKVKQQK